MRVRMRRSSVVSASADGSEMTMSTIHAVVETGTMLHRVMCIKPPNAAHHRAATGGEAGGWRSGAWACSASARSPLRLQGVFVPSQAWAIEEQRKMVEDISPENAALLVDDQVLAFEEALQE